MEATRKLAAILIVDVVGFSLLTAKDEDRTLSRVRALRSEIFSPTIERHHGRIVKSTGDGLLTDFRSVVDAINCAIEVQELTKAWNADIPTDQNLVLRMGIHLGDVVEEDDGDIMGDGVNIAARLESIADPGGIYISQDAYRQIRSRLDIPVRDMGERSLKNIPEPMRVFAVGVAPDTQNDAPASGPDGVHVSALAGEGKTPLERSGKPSVAVLPFANISGDMEQSYFVDGMADDIITALSRFEQLFVISRNSSFAYKERKGDLKTISRELGVRYLLDGSVRRSGNRVRITGQLVNAVSGRQLWADRYDGSIDDVFDLQDRITAQVVAAIEPTVRQAEIERARTIAPQSLDSYERLLQALPNLYQVEPGANLEALDALTKAIEVDGSYGSVLAHASWALVQRITRPWKPYGDDDRTLAISLARRALMAAGNDAHAVVLGGFTLTMLREDYLIGLDAVRRSLELNPGSGFVHAMAGCALVFGGEAEQGLAVNELAMLHGPKDPNFFSHLLVTGYGHLACDRIEESLEFARRSLGMNPNFDSTHILLITAYMRLGRENEALGAAKRLLAIYPEATVSHYDKVLPFRNPDLRTLITNSLRATGIAE